MAVEVYRGQYVTAEEAVKYIDLYTINDSCRNFNAVIDKLKDISSRIRELKEMGGVETVSIGGKTFEEPVIQYEKAVNDLALYLAELSNTLINEGFKALNRKQTLLNEEARQADEKMILDKIREAKASSAAEDSVLEEYTTIESDSSELLSGGDSDE